MRDKNCESLSLIRRFSLYKDAPSTNSKRKDFFAFFLKMFDWLNELNSFFAENIKQKFLPNKIFRNIVSSVRENLISKNHLFL